MQAYLTPCAPPAGMHASISLTNGCVGLSSPFCCHRLLRKSGGKRRQRKPSAAAQGLPRREHGQQASCQHHMGINGPSVCAMISRLPHAPFISSIAKFLGLFLPAHGTRAPDTRMSFQMRHLTWDRKQRHAPNIWSRALVASVCPDAHRQVEIFRCSLQS